MSVDTTVVIAGTLQAGQMMYTAEVVAAAENLMYGSDADRYNSARDIFLKRNHPWFVTLPLAKQYAHLLQENERLQGSLEYTNIPIIEIADNKVYLLTKKGKRKTKKISVWA